MNTLESCTIISPLGSEEECAKFVIDDVTQQFILDDIIKLDQEYTFSCWLKSEVAGSIEAGGGIFESSTSWTRHHATFVTDRTYFPIEFLSTGTYYIYHPQLEIGNKATDWTPSPDDVDEGITNAQNDATNAQNAADGANTRVAAVETLLAVLQESIATIVKSPDGSSMMIQTEDGWSFNFGDWETKLKDLDGDLEQLVEQVADIGKLLDSLKQDVEDNPLTTEHIEFGIFEDEPCIALHESDSDYKLLITNKRILFIVGGRRDENRHYIDGSYTILTQINTDGVKTDNINVNTEIKQGGFAWVTHDDGNLGLVWKGV